ncbi:MAG: hypothetical protein ACR2QC_11010 [Gammaproteobacteria bacterium]
MDFIRERGKKSRISKFFAKFFRGEFFAEISPFSLFSPLRPIPAKAGISAAAKRRVIVRLYAFGDSLRLSARRFLPSQEWDGWWEWDVGRRREAGFCAYGAKRFRLSPEWRHF